MKKFLVVLILATLVTGGAFAQVSLSAGAGVNLGVNMASYGSDYIDDPSPQMGFGFHGFFDAKYVVAKLGMFFGSVDMMGESADTTNFTIGVLGKFPIEVGSFTIFPMLGFEYNMFLEGKGGGATIKRSDLKDFLDAEDILDSFLIQIGVGADFNITDKIYIRPTILWGIDVFESDLDKAINDAGGSVFQHKLDIGVAVGFKF